MFGSFFEQLKQLGQQTMTHTSRWLSSGVRFAREAVGSLPFLGSAETSSAYDDQQWDEKHYFVIPYRAAEAGYVLYSMRCLPEDVPPINDLPKRRIFHMPHENARPLVEQLLLDAAREEAGQEPDPKGLGSSLNALADRIDLLDNRLFHGFLLVGGLVAFINPAVGAALAAKALLPSLATLLSTFGLKYVGDSLNARNLAKQVKQAEKEVLSQFRDSQAISIVNPLLLQLERALNTTAAEYNPIVEFELQEAEFGPLDQQRMLSLSCKAMTNTYEEVLDKRSQWQAASLQPEDVAWLQMLSDMAK